MNSFDDEYDAVRRIAGRVIAANVPGAGGASGAATPLVVVNGNGPVTINITMGSAQPDQSKGDQKNAGSQISNGSTTEESSKRSRHWHTREEWARMIAVVAATLPPYGQRIIDPCCGSGALFSDAYFTDPPYYRR